MSLPTSAREDTDSTVVGDTPLHSLTVFGPLVFTRCSEYAAEHPSSRPSCRRTHTAGAVYFGCVDGLLYAVAPEGAPLWTFDAAGPIFSAPCAFTASLGAGLERRLLVTSQSGRLLCVEAVHGALRWEQPAEVHGP